METVGKISIPQCPGELQVGDYVFATRWADADWNDPWAVGFVREIGENHILIGEQDGSPIPSVGNRCFPRALLITQEQGARIAREYPPLERSAFIPEKAISIILGER